MHLVMIGGSDAGISAALRARELDPGAEVTVVAADVVVAHQGQAAAAPAPATRDGA